MLINNLKIAFRQLRKQRLYSIINIMGLAVGMSCCLLIALHISDELSYDKFHEKADRIYRVAFDINFNGDEVMGTNTPAPLAGSLEADFPEVEKAARLTPYFENGNVNYVRRETATTSSFEEKFAYVDPEFFDIFDFPLLEGEIRLNEPLKMVITRHVAEKLFGKSSAVGQVLVLNDKPETTFEITAVIENIPENSHFHFDYFMSMETLGETLKDNWIVNSYFTYALLQPNTKPETLEQKFLSFAKKYIGPQFKSQLDIDFEEILDTGARYNLSLQTLTDIHLKSQGFSPQLEQNGDIRYVRMFAVIAFFILFIAMVNFINLSTARSANRAKEVGVRKVIGSMRQQLIGQFLSESLVVSFLALIIGIVFAGICLPYFNEFTGKNLQFPFLSPIFLASIIGVGGLIGILAGIYPAFYLSAFQPIKVLKGQLSRGAKSGWLRSSLVVLQFSISVGLIAATLIVGQQMNYIQNKKLGFEKDQVLLIKDTYVLEDRLDAFREELERFPEVQSQTANGFLPLAGGFRNASVINVAGRMEADDKTGSQIWPVDEKYLATLDIELIAGRNFERGRTGDENTIILNETATKKLGIADNSLNQRVELPFRDEPVSVIGVMKDFHFESLRDEIAPLGLLIGNDVTNIAIKTGADQMSQLIKKVEQLWMTTQPGAPFRYNFLDEKFAELYEQDRNMGTAFSTFAVLAIFIACLGLFALAIFMIEQRRKEIGVRKVLGASMFDIVVQLNKNFTLLVLIATVVAVPVAWYFMDQWLADFSYRMDLQWWVFVAAGLVAMTIALLTVSFQSIRAAVANPIESLRNE